MSSGHITKKAIADRMKKLMEGKPLAKISVGDIVNACGITRNSFYYHFKDKYHLVNWIFYTEIIQALQGFEKEENASSWDLIETICRFFYDNRIFYQNALSVSGQNSFIEYFNEVLQGWVKAEATGLYVEDEDQDFFASFFSYAFVSVVSRWLLEGARTPPDKFAQLIKKATTGMALQLIEKEGLEEA